MCGEHCTRHNCSLDSPGSSPRVRGTLLDAADEREAERFIPACAGNTAIASGLVLAHTVHPRVCGEHPCRSDAKNFSLRFIPACAGNTQHGLSVMFRGAVHPRVCGEHCIVKQHIAHHFGSSPRVRGTLLDAADEREAERFIPACAGNTAIASGLVLAHTVHPRVCGEHPCRSDAKNFSLRFIPACAGNTQHGLSVMFRGAVHPRVCGEHCIVKQHIAHHFGSSPRVRGTHYNTVTYKGIWRFIPACAGNTLPNNMLYHFYPVHPRVCGEHMARLQDNAAAFGSSPRVRGTRIRNIGKN